MGILSLRFLKVLSQAVRYQIMCIWAVGFSHAFTEALLDCHSALPPSHLFPLCFKVVSGGYKKLDTSFVAPLFL